MKGYELKGAWGGRSVIDGRKSEEEGRDTDGRESLDGKGVKMEDGKEEWVRY